MDFGASAIEFLFMKPASDPSAKTFASVIRYSMPESAMKVLTAPKNASSKWKFPSNNDEFMKDRSL